MQVESVETGKMVVEKKSKKSEPGKKRIDVPTNKKRSNKLFKREFNKVWNSTEMNITHHFLGAIFYLFTIVYFMIIEPSLSG